MPVAASGWDYLLALWPLMQAARSDGVTRTARPKGPRDRAGHNAVIAKAGPPFSGVGLGEGQTKFLRACLFGARLQLPADITLKEAATMDDLAPLAVAIRRVLPLRPAAVARRQPGRARA